LRVQYNQTDVTFSICVRESYDDDEGEQQYRFGVAVTTRLPAVGVPCPHVNEHGAVATQSLTNERLGSRGVEYLAEGLVIDDALQALLNADEGSEDRQLHGVSRDGSFTFSGEECHGWFGETSGENYTVAGNLLEGEAVIERTAAEYESVRGDDAPLAKRLIGALGAGQSAGGDKREDLTIQSAAVKVADTGAEERSYWDDLRVDASENPISELRETFRLAKQGHEDALEKYAEDEAEDGEDAADGEESEDADTDEE
jgi:uncharacterized Ntn-hydrolase superfamily protein